MTIDMCDICGVALPQKKLSCGTRGTYGIYIRNEGVTLDICPDCQKKYVDDYFYKLRCDNGLEPATPETPSSR